MLQDYTDEKKWYVNDLEEDNDYKFKEYEVTSVPNDFNTKTIIDFIESGLFKIPGFQRNYVWDMKKASKLIESLIIGLPIPQVFLYEEGKNTYSVIDGQQRLLTIYFFKKMRFPKKEKRFELRQIFEENNLYPDSILHNDEYFDDFRLNLPENDKLNGKNYSTLDEFQNTFDMRTIRNIMIKQNFPTEDDSSMFEIFNRLNSGTEPLKPQEIRTSLYHSNFYNLLYELNSYKNWRTILNQPNADIHMKDVEIMLRGFAVLLKPDYKSSMAVFLNKFSKEAKLYTGDDLKYFENLFKAFCDYIIKLEPGIFISNNKFSVTIFESIFVTLCRNAVDSKNINISPTTATKILALKNNSTFISATQNHTTDKANLAERLRVAKEILL